MTSLSQVLYPDNKYTPKHFEEMYPERNLGENVVVTRFAPSPTGFVHVGSLHAAFMSERIAHTSGGVFFIRIEDTDQKREIEGGVDKIVSALQTLGIQMDEGCTSETTEIGNYGPYKQSLRTEIYHTFAKVLVDNDYAYPCFMTPEELDAIRAEQEAKKLRPGIYGEFAKSRHLSIDDVAQRIASGNKWVLRLKSKGDSKNQSLYPDLIKGNVTLTENDSDIVLIKSDGIPTYHFALIVDDHLMRTTHIIRADEWLPSLPIHLEIFKGFNWPAPHFAHMSPIMKMDGTSKRKLSKRKDPEANVEFFWDKGYPVESVIEYLLNIGNSSFEDWRKQNPTTRASAFEFRIDKMQKSGALFDFVKLNDVSKNVIARMPAIEVYNRSLAWAQKHDAEFAKMLLNLGHRGEILFSIERTGEKIRKDISCFSEIKSLYSYFFDELFETETPVAFPAHVKIEKALMVLTEYISSNREFSDKNEWFENVKKIALATGFCTDMKEYKANPTAYVGSVSDVAMILRISVTKRSNTPDLFEVFKFLGIEKVNSRLKKAVQSFI